MDYIIITPARNEERTIEMVINCMIEQTILPKKWIIVNDGSTDDTERIVLQYSLKFDWIKLINLPEHDEHNFHAKVTAFNAGIDMIKGEHFDLIGNLDADLSFDTEYFEYLIQKFQEDPLLGVAGTPFMENNKMYDYKYTNIEHVSGACQLFRAECYTDIGGYLPIRRGGIDWVAVTTARMKGWHTRTFLDKCLHHHRKMGSKNSSWVSLKFRLGIKDYNLGNGFLWELFRSLYQMKFTPIILGGIAIFFGYLWACICHRPRPISNELLQFIRKEQRERLRYKLFLNHQRHNH